MACQEWEKESKHAPLFHQVNFIHNLSCLGNKLVDLRKSVIDSPIPAFLDHRLKSSPHQSLSFSLIYKSDSQWIHLKNQHQNESRSPRRLLRQLTLRLHGLTRASRNQGNLS